MEKEEFRVYKDTRYNSKGALWEVSNYGNVRKNGEDYIPKEGSDKYLFFGNYYRVHRAVAELFVSNTENKPSVDHINRDRQDNRASNLRWATYKEQAENRDNEAHSKLMIGNKYALGNILSVETRAKISAAMSVAKIGNKNVRGKVWVFNPTTEQSNLINPSQLTDYLAKGYIRGREKMVWVFNPTTEHRTLINPSQLNDYLSNGYIKGKKIKK